MLQEKQCQQCLVWNLLSVRQHNLNHQNPTGLSTMAKDLHLLKKEQKMDHEHPLDLVVKVLETIAKIEEVPSHLTTHQVVKKNSSFKIKGLQPHLKF